MPEINNCKLYTRAEIEPLLLGAGQFAHAKPAEIARLLNLVYRPERRFDVTQFGFQYKNDHAPEDEVDVCIHIHFVKAYHGGHGEQLFSAFETVQMLEYRIGFLCPLCYHVSRRGTDWTQVGDTWIDKYTCPSMLLVRDARRSFQCAGASVCKSCRDRVNRILVNQLGVAPRDLHWEDAEPLEPERRHLQLLAISHLIKHPAFRQRVKENASTLLRFDPRRVPAGIADQFARKAAKRPHTHLSWRQ